MLKLPRLPFNCLPGRSLNALYLRIHTRLMPSGSSSCRWIVRSVVMSQKLPRRVCVFF